jgi:hypothetical protein
LQDQLVSDLAALSLRQRFVLLLTSQTPMLLPLRMDTTIIRMGALDAPDRQAILASYQAPEITGISESFQTAYELSIAAECAAELKPPVTRAQLFDAYVRRNLNGLSTPAATRAALRQVALAMDEQLTAVLPVDEVWRSAERALAQQSAAHAAVDDLFRCKLVRTQQGSLAFSHELIGRFLIGEALLLNSEPRELVRELERPRHADLPELVIPLETRIAALRSVLTGLASTELSLKSLDGELGSPAGDVASREAYAALAAAGRLMDEVTLAIQNPESFSGAKLDRDGLSRSACAVLAAVAKLLPSGRFLNEALKVFDATDLALHRAAHAAGHNQGKALSPSTLVANLIGGRQLLPAAILIEGCEHSSIDCAFGPEPSSQSMQRRLNRTFTTLSPKATAACTFCAYSSKQRTM